MSPSYDDYAARFLAAIRGLPTLECEVVTRAAERLAAGAQRGLAQYGPLDASDRRDMAEEAAQEAGDGLFYLTWASVLRERRARSIDRDTEPCAPLDGSELDRG